MTVAEESKGRSRSLQHKTENSWQVSAAAAENSENLQKNGEEKSEEEVPMMAKPRTPMLMQRRATSMPKPKSPWAEPQPVSFRGRSTKPTGFTLGANFTQALMQRLEEVKKLTDAVGLLSMLIPLVTLCNVPSRPRRTRWRASRRRELSRCSEAQLGNIQAGWKGTRLSVVEE